MIRYLHDGGWTAIILARVPLDGNIAENVLKHGCGALNIDASRVGYVDDADKASATPQGKCTAKVGALAGKIQHDGARTEFERPEQLGRFPANVIHSGSPDVLREFDLFGERIGMSGGGAKDTLKKEDWVVQPYNRQIVREEWLRGDTGSAARFFASVGESPVPYLARLITPPGGTVFDPFPTDFVKRGVEEAGFAYRPG
jgi:site-specific DNA-methyltransferase (adenine-specific)